MQQGRPSASERLESDLGGPFTRVLFESLRSGPESHGLRPRRAA